MGSEATIEEHWRNVILERLQKMETTMENVSKEMGEIKTSSAVSATESKQRTESMTRLESEMREMTKGFRDLEKKVGETPKGQEDIEKRLKDLEEWKSNLTGRLVVVGSGVGILIAILTEVASNLITGKFGH